ncbi:MAG: ABC transporter ATP-binding protein [Thermoplasmata archaeon]
MEFVIRAENLTKKFGNFVALDDVSFRVKAGEIYGLLGPNGAGKTTLVKILNGIMKPTEGKAYVLGTDVGLGKNKERVGYMPQETALYLDNTVHENLLLFGEIYGLEKKEILRREAELLEFVNLSKWSEAMVTELSGGMRHRLSLACALIHEPEILFLDEPTVGVDPELRVSFWEYFYKLRKKGTTILLTTHYMDEAEQCTLVGLMRNGRLIAEGEPEKLKKEIGASRLEEVFLHFARGREK